MSLSLSSSDVLQRLGSIFGEFWPILAIAFAFGFILPEITGISKMIFTKQPYQMKKRPNHYYRENAYGRREIHLNRFKRNVMW